MDHAVWERMTFRQLDTYARDFALWRDWAAIDYQAATILFETHDPFLLFPAATLGHHALEMYLKSALIANGLTIFDPKKVRLLDPQVNLVAADCAWGHDLVELAKGLAQRSATFEPSRQMSIVGFLTMKEPMTIEEGLSIFNPFFGELRYPQKMNKVDGIGEEHKHLLDSLVSELRHARLKWNQLT
jgi:hypothetical protein